MASERVVLFAFAQASMLLTISSGRRAPYILSRPVGGRPRGLFCGLADIDFFIFVV